MGAKKFTASKKTASAIIILGILAAFAGVTAARYVMQRTNQGIIAAQDFYFTSDFLKEESDKALYFIDPKMPVTIHLYNSEDSLRTTPGEIRYQVAVTGGTCTDPSKGVIGSSSKPEVSDLTIEPDEAAQSVTVTVTSTTPYKKVLTAEFKIEKGNAVVIEDNAGSRAAVLTMTCADDAKTIEIALPAGVIPDQTNDNVISFDTSGRICSFHSPGYGMYSLILFKSAPGQELSLESGDAFAGSLVIGSN